MTADLTVLHVVESTTGGVGRHVLDLSITMHRAGVNCAVVCPRVRDRASNDVGFVDQLAQEGVPTVLVPLRRGIRPWADLVALLHLVAIMRRGGYDVVHTHSSKAGIVGRVAARLARVPVIVYSPHAFAFLGAQSRGRAWLYRTVERWLGRIATDVLICVSESERDVAQTERILPAERLVVVPNEIDVTRFALTSAAAAKNLLGIAPERPVVGFVGRLAAQKGVEHLIRAASRVVEAVPEVMFVLIGEGDIADEARQMVEQYDLRGHVMLTGYRADVERLLPGLDLFVLPSLYEGLPYTLLEAMASGCSVLATDVYGNRDLIEDGETGVLVPPGEARALADRVIRLLSEPGERARLGANARSALLARPSLAQMADHVLRVYEVALGRVRRQ